MTVDHGKLARQILGRMVDNAGGVDAAAAILTAQKGVEVHKSTVSRMVRGDLPITFTAVVALEDALGVWPLTKMLHRRIGADAGEGDLRAIAAEASVECGEAVAAVIMAFGRRSIDPTRMTGEERDQALAEAMQAFDVLGRLIDRLQAGEGAE